tara:strand:- start:144 stop:581 length:438 start_codon:yes stop_codon:yes gene_type:complete
MEHKITCPVCKDNNRCFEEKQEHFSSFMCFNCGFMSDTRYKQGSLDLLDNMRQSPALIQDLQFEDTGRGIVWFPCVINMGTKGIIFPEGVKEEYVWKYAKVVEIPEDEREKYDNYDSRLDVENAETYEKFEFLEACKSMGITQDL